MSSPAARLLADLSGVLASLGLRWYVFGAQAVLLYARPRLTEDVDVTVFLGDVRHDELAGALLQCGFEIDPVADADFIRATRVMPFVHRPSGMALDLVLGGPGLEELFVAGAVTRVLGGVNVPVIGPEHLLVTKILAGRDKDLGDAQEIIVGVGDDLNLDEVRQCLRELDEALGRSDLTVLFETMVENG